MGCDTKLFVATKTENITKVMPKVLKALNEWQRNRLDQYWNDNGFRSRLQFLFSTKDDENYQNFSNGVKSCNTYDFESFSIYFTVENEDRRLFVTHSCSSDYSEFYEGDKIIFSLGTWGMSTEIMKVVAETVKEFGDVYFCENDCVKEIEQLNSFINEN